MFTNSVSMSEAEHNQVARFCRVVRDYIDPSQVKVILDVGSRDALVAIALKGYFPNAIVYAFECNPPAIELCQKNIGTRQDLVLVQKAVSDVSGLVDFYAIDPAETITPHRDGNIGASSLFIANPSYPHEKYVQRKIEVEAVTLQQWAKQSGVQNIDIVWIDLQGAELKAFMGMGELLSNVKIIYTEVEFKEMYVGQPLFGDIDRYLGSRGFFLMAVDLSDWLGNAVYIRRGFVPNWFRIAELYILGKLAYTARWVAGIAHAIKSIFRR